MIKMKSINKKGSAVSEITGDLLLLVFLLLFGTITFFIFKDWIFGVALPVIVGVIIIVSEIYFVIRNPEIFENQVAASFLVLFLFIGLGLLTVPYWNGNLTLALSDFKASGTPQNFNSGGRYVFDGDLDRSIYDLDMDQNKINFDGDLTIYLGSGWDDTCYSGLIAGIIYNNDTSKVVAYDLNSFETINHDSNRKNIPAHYNSDFEYDLTNFSKGNYYVAITVFMTTLDDTPYTGLCKTTANWNIAKQQANDQFDIETQTELWFTKLAINEYVRTDVVREIPFSIDTTIQQEEPNQDSYFVRLWKSIVDLFSNISWV